MVSSQRSTLQCSLASNLGLENQENVRDNSNMAAGARSRSRFIIIIVAEPKHTGGSGHASFLASTRKGQKLKSKEGD